MNITTQTKEGAMRDFSNFVGGQCEIQKHLSERDGRRVLRGDIKSIRVTDTELDIYFDWLANWSLENGYWIIVEAAPEHLRIKVSVDKPSKLRVGEPNSTGMILVDISALDQFLLLYPKDYTSDGRPDRLDRTKVEARQKQEEKLVELNARASGSSRSDDV